MTDEQAYDHAYWTARDGCALFDNSDRGKLALSGADAKEFLQGQVTNDILALTPGHGRYAAFLTAKGKMLGDLRVLDTGEELLLDTERVALQALFDMVRRYSLGYDVTLDKRTLQTSCLTLLGAEAGLVLDEVCAGAMGLGHLPAAEHEHLAIAIDSAPVRIVRTSGGYDLLCAAEQTETLTTALTAAGAEPVGSEIVECLRIESGRPRYGVDLDDSVIPQEAGLNDRAVSFTKGCYVGQETVARLHYKGKPNRHLRGLRAASPLLRGDGLAFDGRDIGTITSAAISPRLGPIGLALVRREAPVGSLVNDVHGSIIEVVELPFH